MVNKDSSNKKVIMGVKDITSLMDNPSKVDVELIERAYTFAENAHKDHKRKSGDPYFIHLFETAKTLAEFGMACKNLSRFSHTLVCLSQSRRARLPFLQ